jgi:hypothetical protein
MNDDINAIQEEYLLEQALDEWRNSKRYKDYHSEVLIFYGDYCWKNQLNPFLCRELNSSTSFLHDAVPDTHFNDRPKKPVRSKKIVRAKK